MSQSSVILTPSKYSPTNSTCFIDVVTAHFVAPAQFVVDDKMCSLNGTFCRLLHKLSPQGDKMCSCSRHFCRQREREREFIMLLKVISLSPQNKHVNQTLRSATNEPTAVPHLTYCAHIVTMLPRGVST